MISDISFALRRLRKSPLFTLTVLLTLTLGIGANTAIFSVASHVLGSLPYPDGDRLVRIYSSSLIKEFQINPSVPDFLDVREQVGSFERVEGFRYGRQVLDGNDEQRVAIAFGSAGLLGLVGADASSGRLLNAGDMSADSEPAALLSYGLWMSRYGGDEQVVGRAIRLGSDTYTVVGVLSPIEGPLLSRADVFAPWIVEHDRAAESRGWRGGFTVLARLREGASLAQAQAELDVLGESLRKAYPAESGDYELAAVSLYEETVGTIRPALLALNGATILILLIALANIANLLMARGSQRRSEMAVRAALGASRARLTRLLLTESVLLSLGGGAAGMAVGWALVEAFLADAPPWVPRIGEVQVDSGILLTGVAVSVISGLLFGLGPVFSLRGASQAERLNESGRQADSAPARGQAGLVMAQLALSLVLLMGSGLMIRSFLALSGVPLGVDIDQIVTFSLGGRTVGNSPDRLERLQRYETIRQSLESIPGVTAVTLTSQAPLSGGWGSTTLEILTGPRQGERISPDMVGVSEGFFSFFGSRAIAGRLFGSADASLAAGAVVVDANLARQVWPDVPAVGQRLAFEDYDVEVEVIGVVEPIRYGDLAKEMRPKLYNLQQHPIAAYGGTFLIRHQGDPEPIMAAIRTRLEELSPSDRLYGLQPLDAIYESYLRRPRFYLYIVGGLGLLALAVASVGVYGVMSYSVSRRRPEIGIRMALGASRGNIFKLFYRRMLLHLGIGLACGAVGGLWLSGYLEALLFQVEPTDPVALLGTAVLLSLTATLAVLIPLRRALSVDPATTLRE